MNQENQLTNVRSYGPTLEEVGFGTSWLQEIPYLKDDVWGEHFRSVGFNPNLIEAWRNKGTNKNRFSSALEETFDKPLVKTLKEYEKQGIGSDRRRFYTVQLDANFLEEMMDSSESGEFFETFFYTLRKAREEKMIVNIFVNQYAGIKKGDEEFASIRYQELSHRVLDLLHENGLNGDDKDIILQSIPERDKTFWFDYADRISGLGGNAFRFSCEWSRVMNEKGEVNQEEIKDLAEIIEHARSKGVEVSLCLNHFTMPEWINEGWANPDVIKLFGDYSEAVYKGLEEKGALPKRFLTINEAMSVLSAGFLEGSWYPYEKITPQNVKPAFDRYSMTIENTRKAHLEAYRRIKNLGRQSGNDVPVGFTHNMAWFSPYMRFTPWDEIWSLVGVNLSESWIKDALGKDWEEQWKNYGEMQTDFVAVQFYNEHTIGPFNGSAGSKTSVRDLIDDANRFINGWKRYPEGMIIQLLRVNSMILKTATKIGSTKLPGVVISEFGVPGLVDPREEIKVLSDAITISRGLSNLEYFAGIMWTLFNNFELGEGYGVHFGHFDHNGESKEKSSKTPKKLNLKDRNIRFYVNEYEKDLKAYVRRLRIDEGIPVAEKSSQIFVAESKLTEIKRFIESLSK